MQPQALTIHTAGGHDIVARLFQPQPGKAPAGICIIAPATGVAQYLYDDFAYWLADQGYLALTFDYEGMGLSVTGPLKYCRADKLSWAKFDGPAVLKYVAREIKPRYTDLRCIWIGHSVGGHLLGYMGQRDEIDEIITVAAGTGTWWYNSAPTRRFAWFLWYFLVPVTVPLLGYYPGKKLGIMCDMPKGVMLQWRRWCLNKDYAVGAEGEWMAERFASVTTPINSIEFSDDEMMSPKNIRLFHRFFRNAPQQHVRISPEEVGQKRIGHIGWHKGRYRALWERVFLPRLQQMQTADSANLPGSSQQAGTGG